MSEDHVKRPATTNVEIEIEESDDNSTAKRSRVTAQHVQCHCEKCQGALVHRTTANRHLDSSPTLRTTHKFNTIVSDIDIDNSSNEGEQIQDNDGDGDQNQNNAIEKFVLRTLKNKVKFGWSREETLHQLQNFYEYERNEEVPHENWQKVLTFLRNIGYHDPKVFKVCCGEDHIKLLYHDDEECPICDRERDKCVDYYVLGIDVGQIFANKENTEANMAHWENREEWFNKVTVICPKKELWHGQRFCELSYFWDEEKESALPVQCQQCKTLISTNDISEQRNKLGVDDENCPFPHTCSECLCTFTLYPQFMKGCPLNQAFVFHEDGFNAFFTKSRGIATIQLSNACSLKESRSTGEHFQVYSFIPTCHLSDGIVHKLDAFFQPLIDEISDLYLNGKIVELVTPVTINKQVFPVGKYLVRALLLLGTADLKAHQDIALYAVGGKKGCRKCLVTGTYIPEKRHYYYGNFGTRYRQHPEPRTVAYLYEHGLRCESAINHTQRQAVQIETGVKGITILFQLYELYGFDPVRDMTIDRMHMCFNLLKRELLDKFWPDVGSNIDKEVNRRDPSEGGLIIRSHFADSLQAVQWTTEQRASGVARLKSLTDRLGGWKTAEFNKFSQVAREVLALLIPSKAYDIFMQACLASQMLYCKQLQYTGWKEVNIKRVEDLLWSHAIKGEQYYGLPFGTENLEYSTHIADDIRRHSSPDNYTCELFERGIRVHRQQKHNSKGLEKTFTDRECLRQFIEAYERKNGPLSLYMAEEPMYCFDMGTLHDGFPFFLHESSMNGAIALIKDLQGLPNTEHVLLNGVSLGKMKRKCINNSQQHDITRYLQHLYPNIHVQIPNVLHCPKAVVKQGDFGSITKYKVGDKCIIAAGGDDILNQEEWFVEITQFFQVGPLDDKYFMFVDCLYYIPGFITHGRARDVAIHEWTGTNKLIPHQYNHDSVQPFGNLKRKCILFPDPENLQNPQYHLPIDFDKPDVSSKVLVPVVPIVNDDLKVKGVHNEVWYARVLTVDLAQRTVVIKWYFPTRDPGIWTLSNNEDTVHFNSIISLVSSLRAPGGPRKFRFVDA